MSIAVVVIFTMLYIASTKVTQISRRFASQSSDFRSDSLYLKRLTGCIALALFLQLCLWLRCLFAFSRSAEGYFLVQSLHYAVEILMMLWLSRVVHECRNRALSKRTATYGDDYANSKVMVMMKRWMSTPEKVRRPSIGDEAATQDGSYRTHPTVTSSSRSAGVNQSARVNHSAGDKPSESYKSSTGTEERRSIRELYLKYKDNIKASNIEATDDVDGVDDNHGTSV